MEKLPKQVFASTAAHVLFNKTAWMQHTGGFYQENKRLCSLTGGKLQWNDAGLSDWTVKTKLYGKDKWNNPSYCELWPTSDQVVGFNRGFQISEYTGGTPFIIFHCKDEASKQFIISHAKQQAYGIFSYTSNNVPLGYGYTASYIWTNGLDVICADIGNNRFGMILGTPLWDPKYVTHISIFYCQSELKGSYLRKSEY